MKLIEQIIAYIKEAKSLRDRYESDIDNLNLQYKNKQQFIKKEQDELRVEEKQLLEKVETLKKLIKDKIAFLFKEKIINDLVGLEKLKRENIDKNLQNWRYFQFEKDLNPSDNVVKEDLETLKQQLRVSLSRIHDINKILIPSNERKRKDSKDKLNQDLIALDKKLRETLNPKITKIQKQYSFYKDNMLKNYVLGVLPNKVEQLPKTVVFGNYPLKSDEFLSEITNDKRLLIPYEIDVCNQGNIIIDIKDYAPNDHENIIENVMAGIALKYIESFPSGHLRIGIHSSSITSFGKLSALFAASLKGKISLTEETSKTREQFSKLLLSVVQKGEIINAKLLENSCADIYELYDREIRTEDFQLIIVHDVLREMTLDTLNQLHGCVSELSRCGIRFVIVDDFSDQNLQNKTPAFINKVMQILEICHVFSIKENVIKDKKGFEVELISAQDVANNFMFNFINRYCEYASERKAPYLSYEKIGFGNQDADANNFESIIIPVALSDPNVWNIEFDCVGKSPNANLIVGIPGTGKSTLIDSLIMNGAMKYSPDEVIFQLLDFKDGISSSVYTMPECLIPHIKVVSQNNKPEEAEIILTNILAESERRNREFIALRDEANQAIRNIVDYNRIVATGKYKRKNMPRLIIVIDECQYLFDDESLAKKSQDIVRKCRSQGIHLILATQTLSHRMWGTVKFVEGLYCFELTRDDAEQLLPRKYATLISSEVPKGSYMAFASNNSGQVCEKIRIAFDGGDTSKYAKAIRDRWSNHQIDMVTIGDKSAKELTLADYRSLLSLQGEGNIPIGENYNDHTPINIEYEKKRPIFMVGTSQKAPDSMFKTLVYASMLKNIETYLIDASPSQNVASFANTLSYPNITIADERGYLETLNTIYDIYKKREKNLRDNHYPIFFFVNNLQAIVDFINNCKFETKDKSNLSVDTEKSMAEIIASLKTKSSVANSNQSISGKETLVPFLMSNAYKANIFIAVSMDSVNLTNDMGEQVLGYAQRNILRNSDYKFLYPNCTNDIRNVMEDAFKEKMLNGLSEDMALLSVSQRDFYKLRYFQLQSKE